MFHRFAVAVAVAVALAGAAAGGCGKSAPARHQVTPGAKAGVVLEVNGTVTATRPGAAARPLAKGDAVSGDDVIATGADGSVLIELDHNHVTFTLPAGKQQQVATSLAWGQPVAAARPTTTDENSAAAGRAIERSAVDTSASSTTEPQAVTAVPEEPAKPVVPPRQDRDKAGDKGEKDDEDAPPPPPPPDSGGKESMKSPKLLGASDESGGGGPQAATAAVPYAIAIVTTGALTRDDVTAVLDHGKIHACLEAADAKVTIVVTTAGAAGRVTTDAGADATTCVRGVLSSVKFPAGKAETTITIDFSPNG